MTDAAMPLRDRRSFWASPLVIVEVKSCSSIALRISGPEWVVWPIGTDPFGLSQNEACSCLPVAGAVWLSPLADTVGP